MKFNDARTSDVGGRTTDRPARAGAPGPGPRRPRESGRVSERVRGPTWHTPHREVRTARGSDEKETERILLR